MVWNAGLIVDIWWGHNGTYMTIMMYTYIFAMVPSWDEAEALAPRTKKKHASVMCLIFVNGLQTLKCIWGKHILPTFDTSGCSSLRRLGYQTNAQGLTIRPILQRNAATLFELKQFYVWATLKTSWERKSKNLWIHHPCKLTIWQKIVRGNGSQITWDCRRGMLGVIKKQK
jgi:hypothetical protein